MRIAAVTARRSQTFIGAKHRSRPCTPRVGPDITVFTSRRHLAAWAGLCPGNNESAGKRHSGRTRRGNTTLREVLIECAQGAARTRNCQFRGYHKALALRRGYCKATVATAHKMIRVIWCVLKNGVFYIDPETDYEAAMVQRIMHHGGSGCSRNTGSIQRRCLPQPDTRDGQASTYPSTYHTDVRLRAIKRGARTARHPQRYGAHEKTPHRGDLPFDRILGMLHSKDATGDVRFRDRVFFAANERIPGKSLEDGAPNVERGRLIPSPSSARGKGSEYAGFPHRQVVP